MKYTIVWNENKTEGIILSGDDRLKDAEHAANIVNYGGSGVSSLADDFRENVGEYQKCSIQEGLVPMQPTTEMIEAAIEQFNESIDFGDEIEDMMVFIWQAMLGMMK